MNKQITVPMYAYWTPRDFKDENFGPGFSLTEHDLRTWAAGDRGGRVFIKEIQVTFDVPANFDPVPKQVDDLKAQAQKARADFQARITEIDRQIQSLLAIEHVEPSP